MNGMQACIWVRVLAPSDFLFAIRDSDLGSCFLSMDYLTSLLMCCNKAFTTNLTRHTTNNIIY